MKSVLLSALLLFTFFAKAQKVDNIFLNLYTDSLKKGTFNYINVDGLMSTGKYLPLDSNRILFSCSQAKFTGNNLWIPEDFKEEKVTINIKLKEDNSKQKEIVVWVKKMEDPPLRSQAEVLADMKANSRKKKN